MRLTAPGKSEADRMFDMGFEPQIGMFLQSTRPDKQAMLSHACAACWIPLRTMSSTDALNSISVAICFHPCFQNFQPRLFQSFQSFQSSLRQVAMFSATLPAHVEALARKARARICEESAEQPRPLWRF